MGTHNHYSTGRPCSCSWGRRDLLEFSKTAASWEEMKGWKKLQSPEAQGLMQHLEGQGYVNDRSEKWMPWIVNQVRQGNLEYQPEHTIGLNHQQPGRLLYPDPFSVQEVDAQGNPVRSPVQNALTPTTWRHWTDWMNSGHPTRQAIDPGKASISDVHQAVDKWNQDMEDRRRQVGRDDGKVVHSYPDGWTLRQLYEPEHLKREGESMGHCVGSYGDQLKSGDLNIYSLRDPKGDPHVTHGVNFADTGHSGGRAMYVEGTGNSTVKPEYADKLKEYWSTIPPEQRPRSEADDEDWAYNSHLENIQNEARRLEQPPSEDPGVDKYGFINDGSEWMPDEATVNWEDAMNDAIPSSMGELGTPDWDALDDIYNVARAHRQIPWLADEVGNYSEEANKEFEQYYDPGYNNPYNPESGEEMKMPPWRDADLNDPDVAEELERHGLPVNQEGLDRYEEQYEKGEMADREYWENENPKLQLVNHMYKKINPHWGKGPDGKTGYQNEIMADYQNANANRAMGTLSKIETGGPLYYRWVFTPSGVELSHNDDEHPANLQFHQDLGSEVNEQSMVHGYVYRIHNGWRLTDWEHRPLTDPYVVKQVVDAINNEEGIRTASEQEPAWEPEWDFDKLHYGRPMPRVIS